MEEAQRVRQQRSPGTGRRYPLTMICDVYRLARSSVYAAGCGMAQGSAPTKRGPKTAVADDELVRTIRAILAACPFLGESIEVRRRKTRLAVDAQISVTEIIRLNEQHIRPSGHLVRD